ncbi:MAG: mmpL10 [Marmoricola sp.]|nr:mmpL10 [Marmoricola sp.]
MDTNESSTAPKPNGVIRAILRIPLLTMGLWIALGGAGMLLLPSVDHVVAQQSTGTLPANSPTLKALNVMDKAFGTGKSRTFVFVVFESKNALSTQDQADYRDLVYRLKSRPAYVSEVSDYLNDANVQKALTSKDGEATYLPVGLTADLGSSASVTQVAWVREQVKAAQAETASDAKTYVTGDPANLVDITKLATDSGKKTGYYSGILLFVILMLIYRRVSSVVVPLITIGVATMCTLGMLSLAGQLGMGLSTYTESFCVAIVLGAGTDYSIFLISRFREEYAKGGDVRTAVGAAVSKIGAALLASAGTVAISSMVLHFAKLSVFSTTGPPMAVAVSTTVLVSLTITPALLLIFGKKIGPARPPTGRSWWTRVGEYVALKPARILVGGTACLLVLAAFAPSAAIAYTQRPGDAKATESNRGAAALDRHFGKYTTQPNYVLLLANHDMRNSKDLAVLSDASRDINKLPGVSSVRSASQPSGSTLQASRITSQISKVATKLGSASQKINNGKAGLDKLKNGSASLANGASQQASGLNRATGSLPSLISAMRQLEHGSSKSSSGASSLANAAVKIRRGLRNLANGLEQTRSGVNRATQAIGQIVNALNSDSACSSDPVCSHSRSNLAQIYQGEANRLVPGLARTANAANQLADGQSQVSDGLRNLANGLQSTANGQGQVADGQQSFYNGLRALASGSRTLADGLDTLPAGIGKMVSSTLDISKGLGKTSNYLTQVSQQSDTAEAGGFYLPASALDSTQFSTAIKQFLSPDGRVARIQVLGDSDPGGPAGITRYDAAKAQTLNAIKGTTLDGSQVLLTGAGGGSADLKQYFRSDFKLVLIAVLLTVLILMMIVLRALVAPLYLLASVIVSYAAALGSTVIVFQKILGQGMPFNVPVLSFVLLVAVGADYNILLMSRMRENRGRLTPRAVGQAVTATGPVITSAGIIFAGAFLPMVTSSLSAVAQLCFTVVIGLLLDTIIVRTLIVPACAAMLGDRSWWPGRRPGTSANTDNAGNAGNVGGVATAGPATA